MIPKTILLVEDNPSDIALTERALLKSRISNNLLVTEDGKMALDLLLGDEAAGITPMPELPALVLLDLNLPRIGGLEVLRRLRDHPRTRRLPVVVLTSSRDEPELAACYDLGANSYIRKPVDFHQFVKAVDNLGLYWLVLNEEPPRNPS